MELVENLTELENDAINTPSLVGCLASRFKAGKTVTMAGDCAIYLNPMQAKKHDNLYENLEKIISVADKARNYAANDNTAQSVILRGKSGSGKTELSKLLIQRLLTPGSSVVMECKSKDGYQPLGSKEHPFFLPADEPRVHRALVAAVATLDMFGMAPTLYAVDSAGTKDFHPYSSRQARLFSFFMDPENNSALRGFRVDMAGLDTIRLQNFKEPCAFPPYRIFGCLVGALSASSVSTKPAVAVTPTQVQQVLQHFAADTGINHGARGADIAPVSIHLAGELDYYRQLLLNGAGVTADEWTAVVNCLVAIVQLQAITVTGSDSTPGRIANSANMLCVANAESLLRMPTDSLAKILTQYPNPANASACVDFKKFEVIAQIDGMCAEIYERVVSWLLEKCNAEGASPATDSSSAPYSILDLVGWENHGHNINGFAQMQANLQVERLNHVFSQQCFRAVVDSYQAEGIPIDDKLVVVPAIAPVVELFETSVTGIFSALESICMLPKGDDKALVEKLEASHKIKSAGLITFLPPGSTGSASVVAAKYSNALVSRPGSNPARPTTPAAFSTIFSVNHSCGEVTYDLDKFVTINKSYASNEAIKALDSATTDNDAPLPCLAPGKGTLQAEAETTSTATDQAAAGSVKGKFAAFSAAKTAGAIPIKRGNLFLTRAKASFDAIMEAVEPTKCHFIQCIRPAINPANGIIPPGAAFDDKVVSGQIKGLHIQELCMLNKAASYPYQVSYSEFYAHFRPMLPSTVEPKLPWLLETSDDAKCNSICRDLFKRILLVAGLPDISPIAAGMQIMETGPARDMVPVFAKKKVFMKNAIFIPLNKFRNDLLDRMLMAGVLIQRLYRWWKAYKIIKYKIVVPYKHLRPGFYGAIEIVRKAAKKRTFRLWTRTVRNVRSLVIKKSLAVLVYMDRLKRRYSELRIDMAARLIQRTFNKKFIYQIKFARLKRAAQMLQFLSKGYSIRRETLNIVYAARCIRKNFIIFGLKLRKIKHRLACARIIQCTFRGWYEREKFSRIVRILAAKKRLRVGRRCVLKLQSSWRKRSIYQRFQWIRGAAMVLQRWARVLMHRRRFLLVCMLAQWLQTHARRLTAVREVDVLRSIAACATEKKALLEYRRQELLSSNVSIENLVINNHKQEMCSPGGTVMDRCIIGEGVLKDGQLFYSRCVAGLDVEDYSVTEAYPEGWLAPMRKFAHELKTRDKKNVVHVAIGDNHTVVVDEDSNVYTMGSSEFGQLGHGSRKSVPYGPKVILGLRDTLGNIDSVGSTVGGAARGGAASVRPLGGGMKQQFVIKQVACGANYTMLLSASGRVYSWGANDRGQLGYGDFQDAVTPHCISSLKNIAKIACGAGHAAALTHTGAVYTWGAWDCIGRALGRSASYVGAQPTLSSTKGPTATAEPAPLPKMNRRVSMFLAKKNKEEADTKAKSQEKIVAAARANAKRRASTTTIAGNKVATSTMLDASKVVHKDTCEPGLVEYFQHRGIKALICGDGHTTVLHVDGKYGGTMYCWGKNTFGEIGQGAPEPETFILPKRVASLPQMKETDALMSTLHCGGHTMGFLLKGKLYMWGWNKYGQVGAGPYFECVYEPMEVPLKMTRSSEMVTHVTLNHRQSIAMTNYGAVHVWGYMNGLFENPVGTYNAGLGNTGTPAARSGSSASNKLFSGSMTKLFGGDGSSQPPVVDPVHSRGRGGNEEITATTDDLSKCVHTPVLWSSNAGMVETSMQTATGVGPRSPVKRTISRPSELSSASVSNSGREGGYGAIFSFLPGVGVCSSNTMSVLVFDRIKGIEVDPNVLRELSGKRYVSSREVHALPGQFQSTVIGAGGGSGSAASSPVKSKTCSPMSSTIGFGSSSPLKSSSRPGTATTRPGTANATMRPTTSTGVSHEAPRATNTTAMHIMGGKPLVSDISRTNGEFQAEMSRRFKESLGETIAGKVVRRFSNAGSLADAAKAASMQASSLSNSGAAHLARDAVANRGGHDSTNPYGTEESDILKSITTNKPMFGATASTSRVPFSGDSFGGSSSPSSFIGGGSVGVKGYDRSREGKLDKSSVVELLMPTKALSISSSRPGTSGTQQASKPATPGQAKLTTSDLSVSTSKNKIPFTNSSTSSRAAPLAVSPVDKKSLLTSFAQRLNSQPTSSPVGRTRSGSGVNISSSTKGTAKIVRAAPIPKQPTPDKLDLEMKAAEAELELMYNPPALKTRSAVPESEPYPEPEYVPPAPKVDDAGPEWVSTPPIKKKSMTKSDTSVYTTNTAASRTSSTGATINTFTNYNYNVNKQKQMY